jgi:hypothetical protein
MPASPKSKRAAPPRVFEDYILTYERHADTGLYPLANSAFQALEDPPNIFYYGVREIPLGFSVQFGGITYTSMWVGFGWAALADPDTTFSATDIFWLDDSDHIKNTLIKDVFDARHVLFAPWFQYGISTSVYDSIEDTPDWATGYSEPFLIRQGRIPYPSVVNETLGGSPRFCRSSDVLGNYIIVRWTLLATGVSIDSVDFELVVRQCGIIEFRYAPRNAPFEADTYDNKATCGIFMHGGPADAGTSTSTRYRDFGPLLTSATDSRGLDKNGGTVWDGSYTDPTYSTNFISSLNPVSNWPGLAEFGAIFRFLPPKNKRRSSKRDLTIRDSITFMQGGLFDDQRSVVFDTQDVSYPHGIPADYVVTSRRIGTYLDQDLHTSGSIVVSRELVRSMFEDFVDVRPSLEEVGFREDGLHEQGNRAVPFYATGSALSMGERPGSFSNELASKTQFRLTFPVENPVQMIPFSSSIYYYNFAKKQWNIPTSSNKDIAGALERFAFPTSWLDPSGTVGQLSAEGSLFTEDAIGFNAFGYPVVSGSSTPYRQGYDAAEPDICARFLYTQTNSDLDRPVGLGGPDFGRPFVPDYNRRYFKYLMNDYPKSVQRNPDYRASSDETFELPISEPFLIEKIVVEYPMNAGSSWFQDRTLACIGGYTSSYYQSQEVDPSPQYTKIFYDSGGPALTVSVFSQKNYGPDTIMDLIASGTVTHTDDTKRGVIVRRNLLLDRWNYELGSFGGAVSLVSTGIPTPAAVVSASWGTQTFSGSVSAQLESAVSNGLLTYVFNYSSWESTAAFVNYYTELLARPTWFLPEYGAVGVVEGATISALDVFGRGATGFAPSGGSVFGKEYTTGQTIFDSSGRRANPFYVADEGLRAQIAAEISTAATDAAVTWGIPPWGTSLFNFSFSTSTPSPYLIRPGEKLVLAVSKTRPAVSASSYTIDSPEDADIGKGRTTNVDPLIGSREGHDVTLSTGEIKSTFYGSYVREGKNYVP